MFVCILFLIDPIVVMEALRASSPPYYPGFPRTSLTSIPAYTHPHACSLPCPLSPQLHEKRERQLKELGTEADFQHSIQMQRAEQNFRLAIRAKNREISSFRAELDAMMSALEHAGGAAPAIAELRGVGGVSAE